MPADITSPDGRIAAPGMSRYRLLRAYLEEIRSECLRYLRMPAFILPTLLFPSTFYVMFGIVLGHHAGTPQAHAAQAHLMLAGYLSFGTMAPGLFGFGVSLALERDGGLLTLKRALPMPPGAYLLAKMVMAMMVAGLVALLLMALAVGVGDTPLAPLQALALLATAMLGVLPFCALGMWIGTLVKGQGAPAVINLVYLPMSFLAGLWIPLQMLPPVLRHVAPLWPAFHLDRIALRAVGVAYAPVTGHVLVLAALTVIFTGMAARRLRRRG